MIGLVITIAAQTNVRSAFHHNTPAHAILTASQVAAMFVSIGVFA